MRDLMRIVLENAGYTVDLAEDGDAGLEAQDRHPADVVITDIFMPNRDGFETLQRLRTEYPNAKVLVVSGGGAKARGPGYLFTAREIGAHAVLAKPFDNEALLGAVRGLLQ
jgi:DNA-binding response OmpR family regulator